MQLLIKRYHVGSGNLYIIYYSYVLCSFRLVAFNLGSKSPVLLVPVGSIWILVTKKVATSRADVETSILKDYSAVSHDILPGVAKLQEQFYLRLQPTNIKH